MLILLKTEKPNNKETKPATKEKGPNPTKTPTAPEKKEDKTNKNDDSDSDEEEPIKAETKSDYLYALVNHNPPRPRDPVKVAFNTISVTKANFDPQDMSGGNVELSIDINSLNSDNPKRDKHLKEADYFHTDKRPSMKVSVGGIKKKNAMNYEAKAAIAYGSATVLLPVTFTVVETLKDGVRIKAEQKISRTALAIGADKKAQSDEALVHLQLTIKPTK